MSLGPAALLLIAEADVSWLQKHMIRAMLSHVDLVGNVFASLFSNVCLLEYILRCHRVLHITEQVIVVLGPVLLSLLEQEARLDGWILFVRALHVPPLFTGFFAREVGQLATVDANRHVAELRSVVSDHLGPPTLVKLLTCHLRRRHVVEHAQSAVFASVHPSIAVSVFPNISLHEFQLSKHLLTPLLFEHSIGADVWLVDIGE